MKLPVRYFKYHNKYSGWCYYKYEYEQWYSLLHHDGRWAPIKPIGVSYKLMTDCSEEETLRAEEKHRQSGIEIWERVLKKYEKAAKIS